MDLGSILLWSIITLICVVPFIALGRSAKKKKQQDLQALLDFAARKQLSISQYDLWHKSAIGLDQDKQALVFISKLHDTAVEKCVLLEEVQSCRIVESSRMVGAPDNSSKVVDKFELSFTPRDSHKGGNSFEFFNVKSGNLTPTVEYQLAEKWSKIANESIGSLLQSK